MNPAAESNKTPPARLPRAPHMTGSTSIPADTTTLIDPEYEEHHSILAHYLRACMTPSDIFEHLPTLKAYGKQCGHITEFGVRAVVSTWAFMAARPKKLLSYDINYHPNIESVKRCGIVEGIDFTFFQQDVHATDCVIEETELLFIDTLHTQAALSTELAQHASKVSRFLIFHDTTTFGDVGEIDEDGSRGPGLLPAIEDFLRSNPEWFRHEVFENNNGLTILKRVDG